MDKQRIKDCFEIYMNTHYLNNDLRYNIDFDCYLDCEMDLLYQSFKAGYNSSVCDAMTQKDGE